MRYFSPGRGVGGSRDPPVSSPWAAGDKIFCLSEDGDTFVIQAGPQFKLLGKNSLGEMTLSTPALTRDSVIIRTETKLYRIREGAGAASK